MAGRGSSSTETHKVVNANTQWLAGANFSRETHKVFKAKLRGQQANTQPAEVHEMSWQTRKKDGDPIQQKYTNQLADTQERLLTQLKP